MWRGNPACRGRAAAQRPRRRRRRACAGRCAARPAHRVTAPAPAPAPATPRRTRPAPPACPRMPSRRPCARQPRPPSHMHALLNPLAAPLPLDLQQHVRHQLLAEAAHQQHLPCMCGTCDGAAHTSSRKAAAPIAAMDSGGRNLRRYSLSCAAHTCTSAAAAAPDTASRRQSSPSPGCGPATCAPPPAAACGSAAVRRVGLRVVRALAAASSARRVSSMCAWMVSFSCWHSARPCLCTTRLYALRYSSS